MTQYSEKSYKMVPDNTKYNDDGKAVKIWQNIWLFQIFAVPLHSLNSNKD